MALTITLSPEVEAKLRERAAREHQTIESLVEKTIEEALLTPEEKVRIFATRLDAMRNRLEDLAPSSDIVFDRRLAYEE